MLASTVLLTPAAVKSPTSSSPLSGSAVSIGTTSSRGGAAMYSCLAAIIISLDATSKPLSSGTLVVAPP